MAMVLHPERRLRYLQENHGDSYEELNKTLEDFWQSWKAINESSAGVRVSSINPSSPQKKSLSRLQKAKQQKNWWIGQKSNDQWDDFVNEAPYDMDREQYPSVLSWWCAEPQKKRWPTLSLLAIDILSIPPMSDEPERTFSGARRTLSWERAQLSPGKLEELECSKNWIKTKLYREI